MSQNGKVKEIQTPEMLECSLISLSRTVKHFVLHPRSLTPLVSIAISLAVIAI
jgi:hypothetical protein